MERKNLKGIDGYWKQCEILIGVKDLIKLDGVQELKSGFLLLRTKLGPMLAGNGYINSICKASAESVNSKSVAKQDGDTKFAGLGKTQRIN
uniref:Ovule protein n=1 Tax=Loa loa TaxID=7209 RepID=A0A1I7VX17_LOALO